MDELLVNIGGAKGGVKLPKQVLSTWTCMDRAEFGEKPLVYDLNSGVAFPFADNSVSAYYSSHTLEHIHLHLLPFVFSEMYRTLMRKQPIRIIVPDIRKGIEAYLKKQIDSFHRGPTTPEDYPQTELGKLMSWWVTPDRKNNASGHHSAFDWETMKWFLEKAGFRNVVQLSFGKGSPIFGGMDFPRYTDFSLYVEAIK